MPILAGIEIREETLADKKSRAIKEILDIRKQLMDSLPGDWNINRHDPNNNIGDIKSTALKKLELAFSDKKLTKLINASGTRSELEHAVMKERASLRAALLFAIKAAEKQSFVLFKHSQCTPFDNALDQLGNSIDIGRIKKHASAADTIAAKLGLKILNVVNEQFVKYKPIADYTIEINACSVILCALMRNVCFGNNDNTRQNISALFGWKMDEMLITFGSDIYDSIMAITKKINEKSGKQETHNEIKLKEDIAAIREICPPYFLFSIAAIQGHKNILAQLLDVLTPSILKGAVADLAADVGKNGVSKYNTIPDFDVYVEMLKDVTCRNGKKLGDLLNKDIIKLLDDKSLELFASTTRGKQMSRL